MSNAKYLAFDTPNSKKPSLSSVLNAIIFGIDEQCNHKFETALFSNGKTYIIFLFRWGPLFLFFFSFLFFLSFSPSLSRALRPISLSLSPPPRLLFSLHLKFMGLGCGRVKSAFLRQTLMSAWKKIYSAGSWVWLGIDLIYSAKENIKPCRGRR